MSVALGQLAELVSSGAVRVPPYPACALKLQGVLASEDYTTNDLVHAMEADPVFAANLLRLSNSPYYRRAAEVTSLQMAVQRVGSKELVRLAMATSVASLAAADGPYFAVRRQVWRQALTSALICDALSGLCGLAPAEAFLAGLLHDVGKLLVVGALEDLAVTADDNPAWWAVVERFHVHCGELLAQRWHLPGVLVTVITTHHDAPEALAPLPKLVHMADEVVALLEAETDVDEAALAGAGLTPALAQAVLRRVPEIPASLAAFERSQ